MKKPNQQDVSLGDNLKWSESLQSQTREAIAEMQVAPGGLLHMKHKTMGLGSIRWETLANNALVLHRKNGEGDIDFPNADALIEAGWAID